jgi:hypothetical protein
VEIYQHQRLYTHVQRLGDLPLGAIFLPIPWYAQPRWKSFQRQQQYQHHQRGTRRIESAAEGKAKVKATPEKARATGKAATTNANDNRINK